MLITKPSRQQLEALNRCRGTDFAGVMGLFHDIQTQTLAAMVKADQPMTLYRLQGRAMFIEEFLKGVDSAPEMLRRSMETGFGRP